MRVKEIIDGPTKMTGNDEYCRNQTEEERQKVLSGITDECMCLILKYGNREKTDEYVK